MEREDVLIDPSAERVISGGGRRRKNVKRKK